MRKLAWSVFCLALLALPVAVLWGGLPGPTWYDLREGTYIVRLEDAVQSSISRNNRLRQAGLRISLLGGTQQRNDVFISREGLIKNIDAASTARVQANVDAILRFSQEAEVPTYLTLIPTSCAILQQRLPPYAEIYNNQRQLIDDVYSQMIGRVTTMDVYPVLFNRREQYLYYRTENNLTALGGYYVYSVIGAKLVGREINDYSQFNIEYLPEPYYGDLYQQSPYQNVEPDRLSYFHYTRFSREYLVRQKGESGAKSYHTLYPTHLAALGQPMSTYLGGLSAVTRLHISSPYAHSLLIFGDKTALSYVPFLANNYQNITIVDLFQLTQEQAAEIRIGDYDQVLFAYSVETFDSNIPLRAENLL